MKRAAAFVFSLCLIVFASVASRGQTRPGITPADTLRLAGVSDAQISPGGETVVYALSATEGNATRTTLWLARGVGGGPDVVRPVENRQSQPLLPSGWYASNPRWSPDGRRIAFLSTHANQSGIWVMSLTDRVPRLVAVLRETNFFITYAGETFAWSPESRRIAFISASEDDSAAVETEKPPADPRVVDRIQYKSRTSFSDNLRTHVWVVDVDNPELRQLTTGSFYDHAVSWNPNGREVAFLSNHETDPDANNNSDIFAVDMQGGVRQLTTTRGCEYDPQWSPDGKWIAYTATRRDVTTIDSVAEDAHVWVIEARGGAGRELTAQQDRRARSPRWTADSRSVFYLAGDSGQTLLFSVDVEKAKVTPLLNTYGPEPPRLTPDFFELLKRPFQITGFSVGVQRRVNSLAVTLSNALSPAEVWTGRATALYARLYRRATAHNDALMRSVSLAEPEEIRFKSFDDTTVQGWLLKPPDWRSGQRYPLILSIHGGPHGMFGSAFNATFQAYAARGYAVLYLNPRGSSGYGQRFSDGTLREWGGGDYRDLMTGLDFALKKFSWIDAERIGVTGGSYGGFMTNWMVTQTSRFRAAVSVASVSNLVSFYATSLYQDLIHAEFGLPWDDYDLLWRWSPLRYVGQAQTPTLFLHGEQDNDVHITQAEEMYMALKRRGIETVLVRYPREGHGFREPRHRVDAMERTLGWFDRFVKQ
jgi:dipeptidyl aminopeptidase/acylaminoacyl peptidase